MKSDGSLVFDTAIDTKGFQQGTSRLGDLVKGGVINDALRGLFNMIVGQVDAAMNRLDTMDQFARVMKTLTGNTNEANRALSETNDIVVGTAFGLDTAAKGVQAFVASGMSVNKATETMKAWADATAFYTKGTNEDLASVSNALQKMATKGNVTMEHLQMLLERGIPAIEIYARAMGMSTAEVTEQMSKGQLKTEDFINAMNHAFNTGVKGFPSIAGAAKQAGASWQGSIDNMKAAITRGVGSILDTFDNIFNIKSNLVAFGKGIETVLKGMATAFQFLADNANIFIPIAIAVGAVILAMNASTVAATASMIAHTIAYWADIAVIAAYEIATNLATAAQWLFNGAIEACPLVWLLTLITLVIAGIIALTNALLFSDEKYKEYNKDLDEMTEAHDALKTSIEDSETAFEKNSREMLSNAKYASNLMLQLDSLFKEYQDTGKGAEALQNIIGELNSAYEGLNLSLDEETGTLSSTIAETETYIRLKNEEASIANDQRRRNELMQEEASIQAQMNEVLAKAQVIREDTNINELERIDLLKKLGDQYTELEDTLKDNQRSQEAFAKTSQRSMSVAKQAAINYYEAAHGAVDANGDDINALARKYNISVNEILSDIKNTGVTLADWSADAAQRLTEGGWTIEQYAKKWGVAVSDIQKWMDENESDLASWDEHMKESTTNAGLTIEDLAKKWGTTVEQIKQDMFNNNMDLQAWSDAQDEALQDWQDSVSEHQDNVINDFKELPVELDVSFEEMVRVLNDNAEKYREWEGLMVQVSGKLSAESLAKLRELGPGTTQILQKVADDTTGQAAKELEAAFDNAFGAGVYGARKELNAVPGLADDTINMYSEGLSYNTPTAQKAAETTIVATLDTMSSSVFESQSKVRSAWETIKTTILVAFRPLVGEMKSVMTNVMQGMITTMDSMSGRLYAKAASVAKNVLNKTKQAYEIHSPSKAMREIYEMVMQGGWVGMNKKENSLYQKSDEISEGVLQRLAGIPEGLAEAFSSDMSSAIGATHAGLTRTQPIFTSGSPALAAAAAGNVYETNVTFNEPVNQPDVIARRISQTQRYGLAGRRN